MEMTFILPTSDDHTSAFKQLFQELDKEKDKLHIHKYGISDTTMEEVCYYTYAKLMDM